MPFLRWLHITRRASALLVVASMALFAQQNASQSLYFEAVAKAAGGQLEAAGTDFQKVLAADAGNKPAARRLHLIDDVLNGKVKRETGIAIFQGILAIRSQKVDEALTHFDRAVSLDPGYAEAYKSRGVAYYIKQEFDRALADYTQAVKLNPRMAEAYHNRGVIYGNKGAYVKAAIDFTKALEIDPTDSESVHGRGLAHYNNGAYDKALRDFDKALEMSPGNPEILLNRGNTYSDIGKYDLAIADFDLATRLAPRFPGPYFNKAMALENLEKPREALTAYEAFLKHAPASFTRQIEFAKKRIEEIRDKPTAVTKTTMRISAIVVDTPEKAAALLQRLKAGENFAALANQMTMGPGKGKGGDMGYFAVGDMIKELNVVAAALPVGQFSEVLLTNGAYFIIKKTDEIGPQ